MLKNNTSTDDTVISPLEPPAIYTDIQTSNWQPLSDTDPVIEYVSSNLFKEPTPAHGWSIARFSKAVYLLREQSSQWTVIAKYYAPKTGLKADRHANRELEKIRQVQSIGLEHGKMHAITPLSSWRGVLFMDYVKGPTLADVIAMRRSQPGLLTSCLKRSAEFLALLHSRGLQEGDIPKLDSTAKDALDYVQGLAKYGVLQGENTIVDSLRFLIGEWIADPLLKSYNPCLNHGDATTTNFIFPNEGGVVGIDWERLEIADPAADLGRLAAEVMHSLLEQGGDSSEVDQSIEQLTRSYINAYPSGVNTDRISERMHFYQATSTLRIARNGWIPRLKRFKLVTYAMALLIR